MPNNREWAILAWLVVVLVLLLFSKKTRSALANVARALLKPRLLIPLGLLLGYVGLETWAGSKVSLWRADLTKETVIWFLVTGFALFLNFDKVHKEPHFFRNRVTAALGIVVFLEFFTNLFVLSLLAELLLQPFIALLAMLAAVAALQEQHRVVKRLAEGALTIIGFALLAFSAQQLIVHWDEVDKAAALLQLALPVWMTIGLLPFIYLVSVYANYEVAFKEIDFRAEGSRWGRWRAKLAIMTKIHFRTREVHALNRYAVRQAVRAPSFWAARKAIADFRASEKDKVRAANEEQDRLKRYVDVDGTDAEGRRLDRREFKETTDALRWLAHSQMGWHRNRGGRYREEPLGFMDTKAPQYGLPEDHGIAMYIDEDGQSWYAWRRTVTGWCFAVGAAGPRPSQWEYDGPEPPTGFPGDDPTWGDRPFSFEVNRNW